MQRGHYFALVDEADSVLIDDAGTPLIIGLNQKNTDATEALLHWCGDLARVQAAFRPVTRKRGAWPSPERQHRPRFR